MRAPQQAPNIGTPTAKGHQKTGNTGLVIAHSLISVPPPIRKSHLIPGTQCRDNRGKTSKICRAMYKEFDAISFGPCDIEGSARVNLRLTITTFVGEKKPVIETHRVNGITPNAGRRPRSTDPRPQHEQANPSVAGQHRPLGNIDHCGRTRDASRSRRQCARVITIPTFRVTPVLLRFRPSWRSTRCRIKSGVIDERSAVQSPGASQGRSDSNAITGSGVPGHHPPRTEGSPDDKPSDDNADGHGGGLRQ
jgi:hypothetical protein